MAADQAQEHFMSSIKGLLTSGEYSDFTITCGTDTYAVHKAVICPKSDFFRKLVTFGKEADEGKAMLLGDEPEIVKLMFDYLYTADYRAALPGEAAATSAADNSLSDISAAFENQAPFPHTCDADSRWYCSAQLCPHHACENSGYYEQCCEEFTCNQCSQPSHSQRPQQDGTQLVIHAKMYEIADKYNILGLKELVKEKFEQACRYSWDSDKFASAAYIASQTTPEEDSGLRDVIVNTISSHMGLLKKPAIEALMREFNGLAYGLLLKKTIEHRWN